MRGIIMQKVAQTKECSFCNGEGYYIDDCCNHEGEHVQHECRCQICNPKPDPEDEFNER